VNGPFAGDIMLLGYTQSFGAGSADALLLRVPAGGGPAVHKTYGTGGWEELTRGKEILSGPWTGHLIATGISNDVAGGGGFDLFLYKENTALPAGPPIFARLFGGILDDWGLSVSHDPADDGYIAAGYTRSFPAPTGVMNLYLVKTDNTGFSDCKEYPASGVTTREERDYNIFVPHSSRIRVECPATATVYPASEADYICQPTPIVVSRPGLDPASNGRLSINQGTPEVVGRKRAALPAAFDGMLNGISDGMNAGSVGTNAIEGRK